MRKKSVTNMQVGLSMTFLIVLALMTLVGQAMSNLKPQSGSVDQESRQLLAILRDEGLMEREPERVVKAIERLGEIKSIEAIGGLIQLLTFRRTFEWEKDQSITADAPHLISNWGYYPAAVALFQIGKPALPALIKVIETEEIKSLASENARYTVNLMFRGAPLDGVEYLREAAANASSHQAAQRLLKAAEEAAERAKKLMQK